jgi:hypothetical protein
LASKLVVAVSPGLASKPVVGFLVEPQNQGGGGFPGLGLKTCSYSLVIWASKSPRGFLSLGLKTKQASVYQLHLNGDDFSYWKNQTRNYLLSQCRAIWEIVQEAYVIPTTLDNVTQGELQRYENNYMTLNLITTALGMNGYDRVSYLETTHDVWLKLCNIYEGSSKIKSTHRDTYNRQYQTFSQKPSESLDDCFTHFESIVSSLRSYGPLAYSDNERANQLLYALDDHIWGMKITALEESTDFATLDTEKLFSKLKSHELSRKGCPNHDVSLTSKAFVTSTHVGGHVANPTNTTVSFALEFALSSLIAAFDEQYENIPDDEIVLLARKFCVLHKFCKERKKSPKGCFECDDNTHFIANCPKRKKLDSSSNKYDYTKRNNYNKGDDKKKYRFRDKKKKKFQKMMSWACAALSNLDFSSDDSSSLEEDEKSKRKTDDFTSLCLMGKSSRHFSDSNSNVSDDLSPESLSLRVVELDNVLCNQDKLLCKIFPWKEKVKSWAWKWLIRVLRFV